MDEERDGVAVDAYEGILVIKFRGFELIVFSRGKVLFF